MTRRPSSNYFINVKIIDKLTNTTVVKMTNCDLDQFKAKDMMQKILDKFT